MKTYRLERDQFLPISIDEAWDFFVHPANLSAITPPWLGFKILSQLPDAMYPGLMIEYSIKLIFWPMSWVTEITHLNLPEYFVDEQRSGPYRIWHHEHFFEAVEGGVQMKDVVTYVMPFGFIGKIAHAMMTKRLLKKIFDYRFQSLEKRFNAKS